MRINYENEIMRIIKINFSNLNQGFELCTRQEALQNYERQTIDISGYFDGLGSDFIYGADVHAAFVNPNTGHLWIKYAAINSPEILRNLNRYEPIRLIGRVYSYISKGDKKYGIEPEWIESSRLGWHFIQKGLFS